jgi:thymidylate synthase
MITFRCKSIAAAHHHLMSALIWEHQIIRTEDGETTWEYPEPITVTMIRPHEPDMIHPNSSFQKQRCDEYADQLLRGTYSEFDYTYYQRLFSYPVDGVCVNQIIHSIRKLKEQKNTRRAVSVTWHPYLDNKDASVPCLQFIQFLIRKDYLNMICLFRSEDILQAFGPNAYGLTRLMEYVANELQVGIGTYTHVVTVPHFYPIRDKSDLQRWL